MGGGGSLIGGGGGGMAVAKATMKVIVVVVTRTRRILKLACQLQLVLGPCTSGCQKSPRFVNVLQDVSRYKTVTTRLSTHILMG